MTYENLIITLILVVDLISMYCALKSERRRSKARTTYRFNRILKSMGMR
jgi:hypothetical protein